MKIVIDIPEGTYKGVLELWEMEKHSRFKEVIHEAIVNGTVLPKGYGNLKDMNEIYRALHDEIECEKNCADEEYLEGIRNAYAIVDTTHTVIESDKEAEK